MSEKREYNLTTSFALPLLGWKKSSYEPYLINAYIRHEEIEHFRTDHLFVLLKESTEERFKKLEEVLIRHKSHISYYALDEAEEYAMHVFKFVPEVLPDYRLFIEGKYSKISKGAQALIKKSSKEGGTVHNILNRSNSLKNYQEKRMGIKLDKDAEVWSSILDPNKIDKEVFTNELFEKIKSS